MTAPERIWASKSTKGECVVSFSSPSEEYAIPYLRADISDAMVAAAYEDAKHVARDMISIKAMGAPWAISQRTPADARAALDAHVKRAVDEAVKAAYAACAEIARKEARDFAYVNATDLKDERTWEPGSPHDRGRKECGDAIAAAIEARAKEAEGNETV